MPAFNNPIPAGEASLPHQTTPDTPPRPEPAHFDPAQSAWVLSRYCDVSAALRHPNLWPVSGKREIQPDSRDSAGRIKERAEMLDALSASRLEFWRPRLEGITKSKLDSLPTDRPVDLLSEFALPWGLDVAIVVTEADLYAPAHLSDLGRRIFAATGAGDDSALRADGAAATSELEGILEGGPIPMAEPSFIALSQTLPRLLVNSWLALIRHPREFARLRAQPGLLPGALDELLRYAGIVRRVYRRATVDVDLNGVRIAAGDLVVLMLASANRDPDQFPDPDRVDLTRSNVNHVTLGTGRNSCVGALVIRMAGSVATAALASRFSKIDFHSVGEWRTGSGFCFPASVFVALQRC